MPPLTAAKTIIRLSKTVAHPLQVFIESSMPVIKYYEGKGKLQRFDATPPPSEVFEKVKQLFMQQPAKKL